MKKILLSTVLSLSVAFAGLYDYDYNVNSKSNSKSSELDNLLMYGDFNKIIRYDALQFSDSSHEITNKSKNELDKIVKMIKEYGNQNKIYITIIGYTKHVEINNEKVVRESSFSYKDIFPDIITKEESYDRSLSYAQAVEEYMIDNKVSENLLNILVVETRRGDEKAFTEGIDLGEELNHRVMVSLYDPMNKKIMQKVDDKDSDKDGVLDSNDLCPKTPYGFEVNDQGCADKIDLKVNYSNNSSIIRDNEKSKVINFANFLNKYPQYNATIVGHTSSVGSDSYNQHLSKKRAIGIIKMLVSLGIDPLRVRAEGRGEIEPITTNDTKEGQEENRRIIAELELMK